jgi:small subunit ribosomal protein S20
MSAKKAVRSSAAKRKHNLSWKRKFKDCVKSVKSSISEKITDSKVLAEKMTDLQKMLDKSAKEHVIHKNKANRLKSRYAKKLNKSIKKK